MEHEKNRLFGQTISNLINGSNLTKEESYQSFVQVLKNEVSEMQQGAFLAALTAKGETAEEIAGGWKAVYELDTNKVKIKTDAPVLDNCGTGMDSFKTFNISTAASIVGAAGGVTVARHGARAISSKCGTVDIAEKLGVDVECTVDVVAQSIQKTGLGLFNGMSPQIHPNALGRILSKINFGSPLNIAASLANPVQVKRAVRGVYSREMIYPVAKVMKEIGFENALVIHGSIASSGKGIDEASVCGVTYCCHLTEEGIKSFELSPEAVGLNICKPEEIGARKDACESAFHMLRLLAGKENGGCADIVVLNSALIFYTAEIVENIEEGVVYARKLIEDGTALKKLQDWVAAQNSEPAEGLHRLNTLIEKL